MHDEITLGMIGDDENVYPIVAREFHQIPKWLAFRPISEVKASEENPIRCRAQLPAHKR